MKLREFAEKVNAIFSYMHPEIFKRQPNTFIKSGITISQLVILDRLREKGKCKMSDLAKDLHVTKGAVTGMTDRLIHSGFLKRERALKDRRIVWVAPTQKGASFADRMRLERLKTLGDLFSCLTDRERAQYLSLLEKIVNSLKKQSEKKQ